MTRWIGTTGSDPAESYQRIPATGEIRDNDRVAGHRRRRPDGPDARHPRRLLRHSRTSRVVGTDMDDARLASLRQEGRAAGQGQQASPLRMVNTAKTHAHREVHLHRPDGPGRRAGRRTRSSDAAPGCLINIFAGIPAPTKHELDLDTYIGNRCFMFGTSGSTIRDMKIVLQKVQTGQLDTNCSVDAVCGMAGAMDGIAAVENRTLAGKIIVYPQLHDLPLTPLAELAGKFPTVAAKLEAGQWTQAAEQELLRVAK